MSTTIAPSTLPNVTPLPQQPLAPQDTSPVELDLNQLQEVIASHITVMLQKQEIIESQLQSAKSEMEALQRENNQFKQFLVQDGSGTQTIKFPPINNQFAPAQPPSIGGADHPKQIHLTVNLSNNNHTIWPGQQQPVEEEWTPSSMSMGSPTNSAKQMRRKGPPIKKKEATQNLPAYQGQAPEQPTPAAAPTTVESYKEKFIMRKPTRLHEYRLTQQSTSIGEKQGSSQSRVGSANRQQRNLAPQNPRPADRRLSVDTNGSTKAMKNMRTQAELLKSRNEGGVGGNKSPPNSVVVKSVIPKPNPTFRGNGADYSSNDPYRFSTYMQSTTPALKTPLRRVSTRNNSAEGSKLKLNSAKASGEISPLSAGGGAASSASVSGFAAASKMNATGLQPPIQKPSDLNPKWNFGERRPSHRNTNGHILNAQNFLGKPQRDHLLQKKRTKSHIKNEKKRQKDKDSTRNSFIEVQPLGVGEDNSKFVST